MKRVLYVAFVLWAIHANAQTDNINYYEVDESLPVITIESNATDCDRLRPDVWDLNEDERIALRDCMMAYLETGTDTTWQQGDPRHESNFIVLEHYENSDFWHNNQEVGFFTGHREYLKGMEDYLLSTPGCESFVPLPAFNPVTIYDDESGEPVEGGIPDEFFADESILDNFPTFNQASNSNQFPNLPQLTINSETCNQQIGFLDFSNIDDFTSYIESGTGQHGAVHFNIGGVMSNSEWSPASAIFWLWHAYVDDTYRCYQQLCQCGEYTANYDFDNCLICIDSDNSVVIGNNSTISFETGAGSVDVAIDEDNCINMQELEPDQLVITTESGDICPESSLQIINASSYICACTPAEVYGQDCTICFESLRLAENADNATWTFLDADDEPLIIELDSKGCIDKELSQALPPGTQITVQIEGNICPREEFTIEMPTQPYDVDPKFGNSCIELEMTPRNPITDQFYMNLVNNGGDREVSIYRVGMHGEQEELMQPTYLRTGDSCEARHSASHWTNGSHVIHVHYGSTIVAGQIIKH